MKRIGIFLMIGCFLTMGLMVAQEKPAGQAEPAEQAEPAGLEKPAGQEKTAGEDAATVSANDGERIIAKINGQPVYFKEVEKRVDNFEAKFQEVNPAMKLPEDKRVKMRQDFLDRMIREKILEQAAAKGNYTATDAEIDERISQLQKIFGEGEEAKARFLGGITDMADFRENIAKQIRIDKFVESQQKDQAVTVTDAEITEFYNQNVERFSKQDSVEIQQITWRLPPKEDSGYAEKLASSMTQAEAVVKEAQSGRDFTDLVKAHSEDPKAVEKDGKLGWVERRQLVQPLEEVAFNLTVGEVSKPVVTDFGVFVIKALNKQEARTEPLEEVREKIQEGLVRNKQGQSREKIYLDLKNKAEVEILL